MSEWTVLINQTEGSFPQHRFQQKNNKKNMLRILAIHLRNKGHVIHLYDNLQKVQVFENHLCVNYNNAYLRKQLCNLHVYYILSL